jgi:hypothetical protein
MITVLNERTKEFPAFNQPIFLMVKVVPDVKTIHKRAFVVMTMEILDLLMTPKSRLYPRAKAREAKVAPPRPNR